MIELPRYVVSEQIHEGAHASVFRGTRQSDGLPVAVKCSRGEYPSPKDLARLRHEHALMRDLELPGIARAVALERYGNGLALVMQDAGGESLDKILRARRLSLREALDLGKSLAGTLADLHRRQVVHKDIKPHNVLIGADGSIVLIDFGIATRLSQEAQRARAIDSLEGTLSYMAPEQSGRMNRVVDHRSDLYSLGVTLYEALTGQLPFRSDSAIDLVHSHIARRPKSVSDLAPEVPQVVSDIVMKLLAKTAEGRYQHATGLAKDLEHCITQLDVTGKIEPFALGRHDLSDALSVPQKLYGRERELQELAAAFERIARGSVELLLVAGYAGVGKSVLVNEIHKSLARGRGRLLAGKFDQLSRTTPYAPVAHAFRDLTRQLLAETSEQRERWASAVLAALGPNAQLMIDLIPDLELLIGPQPPVRVLGPTESQNRFTLVFQNFLRVFTRREHPLVLFLDDLQWADPASLKLLQSLVVDPDGGHLLLIGAYRDNEVDAGHPLTLALDELRNGQATVSTLTLTPLEPGDVNQFLADALVTTRERAEPLSLLIHERTAGNPFYITQLLVTLHQDGHLKFDPGLGGFNWDLASLRKSLSSESVVDLMLSRFRRFSPDTRRALQLAACIGHEFDLKSLATISELSAQATADLLWPALREGLILPLDAEYRFVHTTDDHDVVGDFEVSYRFLHDRAQQGAYSLIAEEERSSIHLRIGRLMRSAGFRDDDVFEVARHLNLGRAEITDADERIEVATLNLTAAQRAKAATAYEAAVSHLASGLALLDEGAWETHYDLMFALHSERAECEALTRQLETADEFFSELLARARTRIERAGVLNLQIDLYGTLGKYPEAQALGKQALALFGVDLPETEEQRQVALNEALAAVPKHLAGRRIEDLATGAEISDPDQQMVLTLHTTLFPSSFMTSPILYGAMVVRHVNLSLAFGQSPASAVGYMSFGFFIAGVLGQHQDARKYGELALALTERFGNTDVRAKLYFLFGTYAHSVFPMDVALDYLALSRRYGFEVGDFQYVSFTTYITFWDKLGRGDPLGPVRDEVEGFHALMQRTKDGLSIANLAVCRQMLANLEGRTRDALSFSDDEFDEDAFAKSLEESGNIFAACLLWTFKAQVAFMQGAYDVALRYTVLGEALIGSAAGLFFTNELEFYGALVRAILYPEAGTQQQEYLEKIQATEKRIATWAGNVPSTFEHKRLLVQAELARIQGRELEAMGLYDQAIEAARKSEFVRDEALGNELCARFHQTRGRGKVARSYFADAYYGYVRWGATAKVNQLLAEHPFLREDHGDSVVPALSGTTSRTRALATSVLDVATIVAAAHALSGELELDRLLERLMRLTLESAGAQRGVLVLAENDELRVRSTISVDPDVVRVDLDLPIDGAEELPRSIFEHVASHHEPLVLGNALRDPRFGSDPYVASRRTGSVACLPMMRQGRLAGVLYLENNLASDAFTPARNELLQTLSSLAATAIENALLYAGLKAATEELRRTNETLELQVEARTEELRRAMAELWSEMDVARKIQTVLLPQNPALSGYEMAAVMQPAAHVGGDYYDVFHAAGRDWVLVGDVSGHGVPAGLIMMMVQTAVRSIVSSLVSSGQSFTPAHVLARVNAALRNNFEKLGKGHYMTITAFCFEGGSVCYAGLHEDILVHRGRTSTVERIPTRGVWLGVVNDIGELLHDDRLELAPDDTILFVTDGVHEARRANEMMGVEHLSQVFARVAGTTRDPQAIVGGILRELEEFQQADDVTLVVATRRAEAAHD
ncbi:MAG: AAA family ATPase [Polyangiaceae bacterium]